MSGEVSFAPRRRTIRRGWGGSAALFFPVLLIAIALSVGFRRGGGPGDLAASFIGAILFLVAAPTSWVFAFPFIDVTRFTVIATGVATSTPLWYLVGRALADRSLSWGEWLRRYVTLCVIWTVATLLVLALGASLE